MKSHNRSLTPLARELRKNMTPWERRLWYDFLRGYPVRFRRQQIISDYIADFYCPQARLVIELDGSGHYEPEQAAKDRLRTQVIENIGLTVLRLPNSEIDRNFSGVCEHIDRTVTALLPDNGRNAP